MVNVPVSVPKSSKENGKKAAFKKQSCNCDNHEVKVEEEDNPSETPNVLILMILPMFHITMTK